jgi:RimJ/RimL family protein N-acetyltransferase
MSVPAAIRTERLVLRPWRAADAERLEPILYANHAHLAPWIPTTVSTPAPARELARRLDGFAADFAAGRSWRYAVFDAASDDLLGELDLFARDGVARVPIARADRAEIGYWLRADRTGAGYATEGTRAMIDVARTVPAFTRVEIRCDPRNASSAAIPARLGFERVFSDMGTGGADPLEIWMLPLTR